MNSSEYRHNLAKNMEGGGAKSTMSIRKFNSAAKKIKNKNKLFLGEQNFGVICSLFKFTRMRQGSF